MRSARVLAVWAAAAWVALTVLVRMFRGEVVILSGYAAPVVRLVAIVLVFLASCADKLRPGESQGQGEDLSQGTAPQGKPGAAEDLSAGTAPTPTPAPVVVVEPAAAAPQGFPDDLTDDALSATYNWIEPRGLWRRVLAAQPGLTVGDLGMSERAAEAKRLTDEIAAFRARQDRGEAETATTLRALLDAAEAVPLYDAWLAGFVWLHARTIKPAPVELYARVERHLRVANAVVLGQATTGRIEFSAWRSKAGPPPGWREARVPKGLAGAARREFDNGADAGAWETEAVLPLKVGPGSVVLIRRGGETNIAAGQGVRLRRLDVIRTAEGATLEHATLGALVLPRGAELTAWNAGEFLTTDAKAKLQAIVDAALAGDAAELARLEAVLPAAHAAIRAAVAAKPDAPGAAGLRTVLTSFDE